MKADSAVNLEKIQTVLLCQKRDLNLTSGITAIIVAIIAIMTSIFDIKLSKFGETVLAISFASFVLKLTFALDGFQNKNYEYNNKIDYIVWMIEKNK
ncbi:hypothetical protein [Neobacillus vireti]|uniref:hypothetical protein n=1 Tax=Neobacillus vireti TaxID=220686 RepID=UPI002FFE079F